MKLRALLALTALALVAAPATQAQDLAVVDLTKTITEYYKFKEATNQLQDDAAKAQKEINEMLELRRKLQADLTDLKKEAEDPVVSDSVRQKKVAEVRDKTQELLALEREMQETRARRQKQLADKQNRLFSGIREEVLGLVKTKAEGSNYKIIFDSSAFGLTRVNGLVVPVLVHSAGAIDISDEILVELNKNAPAAGAAAPAAAPPAVPAPQ